MEINYEIFIELLYIKIFFFELNFECNFISLDKVAYQLFANSFPFNSSYSASSSKFVFATYNLQHNSLVSPFTRAFCGKHESRSRLNFTRFFAPVPRSLRPFLTIPSARRSPGKLDSLARRSAYSISEAPAYTHTYIHAYIHQGELRNRIMNFFSIFTFKFKRLLRIFTLCKIIDNKISKWNLSICKHLFISVSKERSKENKANLLMTLNTIFTIECKLIENYWKKLCNCVK